MSSLIRSRCLLVALALTGLASLSSAQWTEPDSTHCPQPGPGAQAPWISNDDLRLYFSGSANLYVMIRSSPDSPWGAWQALPAHLNSTPTQRCPAESPSGDTLYFVGDPRTDCPNYGSWDVYFAVRTDTGWGPVQNPGPDVNSTRREFSVGISRDGSILLVASNRLGTYEADLYWHDKQPDGTWGTANHFGPEINDINEGEEHPTLSPDNNRLLFCKRNIMLGDIWESRRVNGVWQQAAPLPSPPNNWPQLSLDEDPCLALDGRTLWFRQADYGGYWYRIVVSVDTTSTDAAEARPDHSSGRKPTLSTSTDTAGSVQLMVEGTRLVGERTVEIHDILGRLVGSYHVRFTFAGNRSSARLPAASLPAGTYIVSVASCSGPLSAKLIHVK